MQRLRVRYTKRGRLRFTSHRDFQRAFERALRRAAVPMAYSAGFSPHPKVSYAGAAPTGVASEAEYLEIALAQRCDPERLRAALDESLPDDLDVLEMVEVAPPPANTKAESLADRLEASVWQVRLPGVDPAVAEAAVAAFLAVERAEVSRMTKNGLRTFDARQAVVALEAAEPPRDPRAAGRGGAVCDTATGRTPRHTGCTTRRRPRRTRLDRRPRAARRPPRSPGWRKARSTSRPERCPTHWHRTGATSAPEDLCAVPAARYEPARHQTLQDVCPRCGRTDTTAPARRCGGATGPTGRPGSTARRPGA